MSRPTKDEFGRPLGGMKKSPHGKLMWHWAPIPKPLKVKDDEFVLDEFGLPDYGRRVYKYINGVRGKLIPLSSGKAHRLSVGPRGGKALQEYWRAFYMVVLDGVPTICRYRHELVDYDPEKGTRVYSDHWEPYSGLLVGIDGFSGTYNVAKGLIEPEYVAA